MPKAARLLPPVALLLFVAGLALHPMAESDLFFHLATGREILRRHALLDRNLFSFTYPNAPNPDTSWLFEVGAAALYARGGFPAIVLCKTLVLLATFAGAYRLCRRRGAGATAAALALAAAAFVGRERFVERPHLFSLAGVVATLAALDAVVERRGRAAVRAAAWFLAAVVVWANLHAGVFLAPLMLGAAAVATAAVGQGGGARRLAALTAATAAAMLVTPVGVGIFRYLALHLTLPVLHPVDEFRAPTWVSDAPLWLYGGAFAVAAVFWAVRGAGDRRKAFVSLAPLLPLAALALHAVRFGAVFVLAAAPLLAVAATAAAARLAPRVPGRAAALLRGPLPVTAAALLIGLAIAPRLAAGSPRAAFDLGLDTRELPLRAIAFATRNGLRDRMYNDFELGAYLLFEPGEGYPRHRVFIDPRLPAYPVELHRLLGRTDLTRDAWSAAMDRYGVDSALLGDAGVNRRVAWWDPARWALVWRQDDARIFVRRLPRFAALIAAREIPATFAFSEAEGTATLPLMVRPASSPVADCEWNRRLGELLFELDGGLQPRARAAYDRALAAPVGCLARADASHLTAWLGAVDLGAGRWPAALALLDRALAAGNSELSTFTDRAMALEALGRAAEAGVAWREVATRAGDSELAVRARARAARLGR